jgi:molybdate transport system regulatory protein
MHQVFTLEGDIEIRKKGKIFLNRKRIELLCRIRITGSILAASKEVKISYQLAWTSIKEINELSPVPVVARQRGGVNGGGTEITKYGLILIGKFIEIERQHNEFLLKSGEEMESCLI